MLPLGARTHGAAAEAALLSGAPRSALDAHLDATIAATPDDNEGAEAALDFYKRLLRLSRKVQPDEVVASVSVVLGHLRRQSRTQLRPDAATGHLAVASYVHHGQSAGALALLQSLHAESLPLSVGSFDLIIQAAGRQHDRQAAYRAYGVLRRAKLCPTAYTLNALLNVETKSGRPERAL